LNLIRFLCFDNRNFSIFWLSELLAYFSISKFTITLLAGIENSLYGHVAQGLVLATSFLPAVFVIPLAGQFIDKIGPRNVLLASKLISASLTIGLLIAWQEATHVTVYLINILNSTSTIFAIVASGSLLPRIVEKDDLMQANTLVNLAPSSMIIAGGATIALRGNDTPTEELFLLVAISFVISWFLLLMVKLAPYSGNHRDSVEKQSSPKSVRAALRYLLERKTLLIIFCMRLSLYIGTGAQVLLNILGESVFLAGKVGIGVLFAARGIGLFLGPLLMQKALANATDNGFRIIAPGLGILGLGYLATGLLGHYGLWIAAFVLAIGYLGAGIVRVSTMALLQQKCECDYLSRLLALEQGTTAVVQSAAAVVIAAAVTKEVPQSALTASAVTGLIVIISSVLWFILIRSQNTEQYRET